MPEQLPQSWVRLSHAARGFAYDWWRTFRGERVSLSTAEVCTAIGTPPKARRRAPSWVAEMVKSGALVSSGSCLRMVDPLGRDGTRNVPTTTPESTHNDPTTYPERPHNDPTTTPEVSHNRTQAHEIIEPKNVSIQREREKERERERAREIGLTWQQVGRLYAERYERETTRPVALHLHQKAFEAIALESGGVEANVKLSLEGFWKDAWASANSWPPGAWAKQFGRHLTGPTAQQSAQDAVVARRRAERAQAEREINEARAAAHLANFGKSTSRGGV